jgi:hypothetical protein
MAYRVDQRSAAHTGGRRDADPIGILIHHWGVDGQTHDGVVNYLASRRPNNPTSAHEVISAGRVTEMVRWGTIAYHARSANSEWIGLECRPEMSKADMETVIERCADIEAYYNKSMQYGRHSDFVNTQCPGRWSDQLQTIIDGVNRVHREKGRHHLAGGKSSSVSRSRKTASTAHTGGGKTITRMAQEIIDGKHGNGHTTRQQSLGVNNDTYAKVRAEVNRRLGVTPTTKSISTMATEVLRGDHGNGHTTRQRSLGVNNATYAKVRAEVNRRA